MKRAAVLVAAGLALAGCGSIHPGEAAVVDGQSISMSSLDDASRVYCRLTLPLAQQQGQTSIDNAQVRQQAISDLVVARVASAIVEERDLSVDRSEVAISPTETESIEGEFGDDTAEAVRIIERSRLIFAQLEAIGADETGEEPTPQNTQQLSTAGQQVVTDELDRFDVEFSPRLGIEAPGVAAADFGSLSVAPASEGDGENADQQSSLLRCS